jgi:hypothetical protein
LIPKEKFVHYFYVVLENINACTDQVLIYEYSTCIHEMLKEIDYWCRMSNNSKSHSSSSITPILGRSHSSQLRKVTTMTSNTAINGSLFDFSDSNADPQDEQIQMSLQIHQY